MGTTEKPSYSALSEEKYSDLTEQKGCPLIPFIWTIMYYMLLTFVLFEYQDELYYATVHNSID